MADRCYLGVDLGAESGRVVAATFDGGRVGLAELHRFRNGGIPIGGTLRWDVLHLWRGILDGLNRAAAEYGSLVASVGVDTWGVDYVLMTDQGEMVGLPYHYRDHRTRGVMAHTFPRVSKQDIFAETGLQFMEINTLYQLLAMRRDSPELLKVADRFLMMPDFFHWCLCGSQVVEFTNATTTQCYHAQEQAWAYDMLKRLELPTDVFPDVVPPGTKLGRLREEVTAATGLGKIEVIAPATHDTAAAVAQRPWSAAAGRRFPSHADSLQPTRRHPFWDGL
jgi:rhamnulokinase